MVNINSSLYSDHSKLELIVICSHTHRPIIILSLSSEFRAWFRVRWLHIYIECLPIFFICLLNQNPLIHIDSRAKFTRNYRFITIIQTDNLLSVFTFSNHADRGFHFKSFYIQIHDNFKSGVSLENFSFDFCSIETMSYLNVLIRSNPILSSRYNNAQFIWKSLVVIGLESNTFFLWWNYEFFP